MGPCLAIDAMGGDGGPAIAVAGVALALSRDPTMCFTLFGDESAVRAERFRQRSRDVDARSGGVEKFDRAAAARAENADPMCVVHDEPAVRLVHETAQSYA